MLVAMWRSRWRARPAAGATTVCPCPRAPRTLLLLMLRLILCPALFLSYSLHRFFSIITNLLPSFFILSYLFHTNKHTQQPLTQPGNFMCILCCGGEGRRTNDTTTTTARTHNTHTLFYSVLGDTAPSTDLSTTRRSQLLFLCTAQTALKSLVSA